MSRHRAEVRPRYGRIAALVAAVVVTGTATLGGMGLIPSSADDEAAAYAADSTGRGGAAQAAQSTPPDNGTASEAEVEAAASEVEEPTDTLADVALPADSGQGRRAVFSESRQRVWLVAEGDVVERTYLASGSVEDNLDPGTYEVYSRSRNAVGIDDSGTMNLFVRFTQGTSGAAIGFHDIPVKDGRPVQTKDQLGTPLSHGCIRQKKRDALAMWSFAPLGTKVVVTA